MLSPKQKWIVDLERPCIFKFQKHTQWPSNNVNCFLTICNISVLRFHFCNLCLTYFNLCNLLFFIIVFWGGWEKENCDNLKRNLFLLLFVEELFVIYWSFLHHQCRWTWNILDLVFYVCTENNTSIIGMLLFNYIQLLVVIFNYFFVFIGTHIF